MKVILPKRKSLCGFTLIELLVAITIVAIMAAVGVVVFSSFQQRARDAKRSQDLEAIAGALEGKKTLGVIFYKSLEDSDFAGGSIPEDPRKDTQKYCFWGKIDIPPSAPPAKPVLTEDGPVDWKDSCEWTGEAYYYAVVSEGVPQNDISIKITSWTICAKKESEDNGVECRSSRL